MKKFSRIILLFVLVATTLLLASCGGNADKVNLEPKFIAVNNTSGDELFVEKFDSSKTVNLDAWVITYNGTAQKIELNGETSKDPVFYDLSGNVTTIDDAVIKEYTFLYSKLHEKSRNNVINFSENFTYRQYLKTTGSKQLLDIVTDFVTVDEKGIITKNGAVLTNSYIFEGKDIKYFGIYSDGSKQEISSENLVYTGFPVGDDLIVNKKYVNHETYKVETNVSFDGMTKNITLNIRLAAQYVPLSTKTATFFNWLFLQIPIAFLMSFVGGLVNGSFAIAIIITTIVVRTLAWPIYAKTNDMSLKMSVAQPDLDRLNRKYATRKDPESQQKMNMEMMAIYKKHKINMFGCLLPFLQMPLFFAMYEVVRRITIPGGQFYQNLTSTKFLWTDLEATGQVGKIIVTVLVGLTMFLLNRISAMKPSYAKSTPNKAANPQANQTEKTMKMMNYFMIVMMVVTSYVTPGIALAFYWIVGNIYSIIQTLINRKLNERKHKKMMEAQLYGKSREIIDANVMKKGDK